MALVPSTTATRHHKLIDYIRALDGWRFIYQQGYINTNYDFHIFNVFDNFWHNPDNIETIEMDFRDQRLYNNNAKKLALDLYGSTVWAEMLLELNECDSPGEFYTNKPIKVPEASAFEDYAKRMYGYKNGELFKKFED